MQTLQSFNLTQSVFTLNMFANLASDKKASATVLTQDLSTILDALFADEFVQKKMGTWQVVWGPIVGEYGSDEKHQYASNALYVAVNQDGQYVVATAGTDPASEYGWLTEDFDVRTMVAWPGTEQHANPPRISSGTSIGMGRLLAMTYNGKTIMDFLIDTFSTSTDHTQLIVTGHSLGGALSAVLALYFEEQQAGWNPAGTVIVCVEPSAGATPGNQVFSDYYNRILGPRTLRFWNSLDPVPHGWEPDKVEMVPFLYYPYLKPLALFKGIAALVVEQSLQGTAPYPEGGFYTQLMPQTPPLSGQVDIVGTASLSGATVLKTLVDFAAGDILKKLGVGAITRTLIIDGLNLFLAEYAGQETIDVLMQEVEARLQKIFGHDPLFDKVMRTLVIVLTELENVLLFLVQLAFQHVTSYAYLMGTASMHPLSESIINAQVKKHTLDDSYTNSISKFFDPKRVLKSAAPKLGPLLVDMVNDDFMKKNNLGSLAV